MSGGGWDDGGATEDKAARTKHSFNICKLSLQRFVVSKTIYSNEKEGVGISSCILATKWDFVTTQLSHFNIRGGTTNRTSSQEQFLKGTPELFSKTSAITWRSEKSEQIRSEFFTEKSTAQQHQTTSANHWHSCVGNQEMEKVLFFTSHYNLLRNGQ